MFCKYCGNELENEALFCTQCGHEVLKRKKAAEAAAETVAEEPAGEAVGAGAETAPESDPDQPAKATNFKASVKAAGKKSRSKFMTVLIVVLAMALATSVAFAAHYVYTTYIAPAPQVAEQNAGEDVDGDGEVEVVNATGNPQNFLQIAELLAMDPADIPDYLKSQGLTEEIHSDDDDVTENAFVNEENMYQNYAVWQLDSNTEALRALDENGEFFASDSELANNDTTANATFGIEFGTNLTNLYHGAKETIANQQDLESGETVDSVTVKLPLSITSDNTDAFIELCGLGKKLSVFNMKYSTYEAGNVTNYITGKTLVNDEEYFWYLTDNGGTFEFDDGLDEFRDSYFETSTLGMFTAEKAKDIVLYNALYNEDEWNAANDETKAEMLAQSIAQDWWTGNDISRTNVLTGEEEVDMSALNGGASWDASVINGGDEIPDWQLMTDELRHEIYGSYDPYGEY